MNVSLFISIFIAGDLVNILLTQSIKQFYYNRGSEASPNIIALINALVVGGGGTAFAYSLIGIAWTRNNILCLLAMILFVWMGSMLGYSKIIETIQQFQAWRRSQKVTDAVEILEEIDLTSKEKNEKEG